MRPCVFCRHGNDIIGGDTIARAFSSFQILSVLCMNSRFFSARETIEQLVCNQSEIPESMPIGQPVCVSSVFHRFNIDTASPTFSLVPRSISLWSFQGFDNRASTKGDFSLSLSLSHRGANFSFSIILLRHVFKRIFSLSFFFPFFLSFVSFYFFFNDHSYLRHGERRLKNSCGLLFFTSSRLDNPRRFVRNFGPILGTKHR